METSEALQIVKILADGVDPTTGEIFESDSVFQNPQVIRALCKAVSLMERHTEREQKTRSLPPNAGKPWDASEEQEALSAFKSGVSVAEIARKHDRTPGAIRSRLAKHGLIDDRARFVDKQT